VAPAIGTAGTDTPKLGTGVLVSGEALDFPPEALYSDNVLFDLAEGADPAGLQARFPRGLPNQNGSFTEWFTSATPAEMRPGLRAGPPGPDGPRPPPGVRGPRGA